MSQIQTNGAAPMRLYAKLPLASLTLPALALGAAWAVDLPKALGAHPWWSGDVLLYGGVPGVILALVVLWLSNRTLWPAAAFTVLTGLAWGAATIGQMRFAASYAEDALAGRAWFFGWIATALFAAGVLTALGRAWDKSRG